jgi:hypothetical protein
VTASSSAWYCSYRAAAVRTASLYWSRIRSTTGSGKMSRKGQDALESLWKAILIFSTVAQDTRSTTHRYVTSTFQTCSANSYTLRHYTSPWVA